MPKKTKTDETQTVVIPKDDNYFEARLSRMPQAIKDMPTKTKKDLRNQQQVQMAYEDVIGEDAIEDEKDRYKAYNHLSTLNTRYKLDAIDRVRSADPNKNAWMDLSIAQATQLLNADADYTGFTQMRTNKDGVREPLTSQYLIDYLATNYQRNNKYDKNTNYNTQTTQVEDPVPEVAK